MALPGNIQDKIDSLQHDHTHGANYFARQALDIIALAAKAHVGEDSKEMLRTIWRTGSSLIDIRPSMSAPIIHVVTALWQIVLNEFLQNPAICPLQTWVTEKRDQLNTKLDKAIETSTENAARAIPDNSTVFLLSAGISINRTIEKAAGKISRAIVAESRPLNEGIATAEHCSNLGIETTLITDAQAGAFIPESTLLLVGADAILPSGSVVNKIGTSLAAAFAKSSGIPVHVVATTWKIHPEESIPLEEKSPGEVLDGKHSFNVRNIYFDITPASHIGSIITENGLLSPPQILPIAQSAAKSLRSFLSNPLSA